MLWPQILLSPCYKDVKQDCSPLSLFSHFEMVIHFPSVGQEENDGKRVCYILAPASSYERTGHLWESYLWWGT